MLFIDGRFLHDRTVTPNVGHSCCRSYQRYADLLVGRHSASTGVLSIPERQKSTVTVHRICAKPTFALSEAAAK
jgi:hypothetical protein